MWGKIQRRHKTSKSGKGSGGETVKRDNYLTWRKRRKVEEGIKPVKKGRSKKARKACINDVEGEGVKWKKVQKK